MVNRSYLFGLEVSVIVSDLEEQSKSIQQWREITTLTKVGGEKRRSDGERKKRGKR